MVKLIGMIVILSGLVFTGACGGNPESQMAANTESRPENTTNFKAELSINLESYQNQLPESDLPALDVLKNNLAALIEHDHKLYNSGFVNEDLADAMKFYYSDQFQYKFTDIESMKYDLPNEHEVHITVIGQRLDTTAGTVEDVKMFYAIQPNKQGEWFIHMID
ncbi:hypothetical protein [Paenibacillus pinihumi]|uniref:hypothetical protein n=1 Tax=Paenibacillus pinihumi TaxID=669462 RepID=UPI00041063EE|nr:hypothetical protein [Paenibacillus pinihumi]